MASFVPRDPHTVEDQRLYTQARLTDVACLDCLARVGVKKNSEHHTSIQWNEASRSACPELGRDVVVGPRGRTIHARCPRLLASIDAAVRDGEISVGAYDGY